MRRLKVNVAAWLLGSILLTALWVLNEWQANGAFERFGHEGNHGDWNPTLWALAVGGWGLIVGIMALRMYFERSATEAELDREAERFKPHGTATDAPTDAELRRFTRTRLERVRRLRFHVAAWVLGMVVLTPLWALLEWQDNGRFERWSNNSHPATGSRGSSTSVAFGRSSSQSSHCRCISVGPQRRRRSRARFSGSGRAANARERPSSNPTSGTPQHPTALVAAAGAVVRCWAQTPQSCPVDLCYSGPTAQNRQGTFLNPRVGGRPLARGVAT